MLLETRFPPDDRVEKEMRTLVEAGYEVMLACSTRGTERLTEDFKGIRVMRLPINRFWYKMSALVLIFPFYLRKWRRFVERIYRAYEFNVIHIHDLPLARVGTILKKKYGIKLVLDQHEYYSNWIVETAHYNSAAGKVVRFFSNWKKYESASFEKADLLITVEPPLKEQYMNEYGIDPQKIITLPNTPERAVFNLENVDVDLYAGYQDHFMLLYFGGIDILRGIDNIIRAIPEIVNVIPEFKFVIAGIKYGGYDPQKTAVKYQVQDFVDFLGWVELNKLPSLITASNLGVFLPPSERDEINLTIATKNYQFLVMQTPIIVGKAKYMKDFTEKNGIGRSVDENDKNEIANTIIELYKDHTMMDRLRRRCQEFGPSFYWENTSKNLIMGYKQNIM